MWKIILAIILFILLIVTTFVLLRRRRSAREARFRASATLLRESQLNMAITKEAGAGQSRYKPVLEVRWKEKGKHIYLFDPIKEIRVGRDFDANQICIRRETVSNEHCLIAMHNGALTVQDLNSSNGTFIKRGLKRYRVNGKVFINNGDCLLVGGVSMKLHLFIFDAAYI